MEMPDVIYAGPFGEWSKKPIAWVKHRYTNVDSHTEQYLRDRIAELETFIEKNGLELPK